MMTLHERQTFEHAMKVNRYARHLCQQPTDWDRNAVTAGMGVQMKYDGFRVISSPVADTTREGVEVECLAKMRRAISDLHERLGSLHVLDCEYVHPEGFDAAISDLKTGTNTGAVLVVFDAVPFDAWRGLKESSPLVERMRHLASVFSGPAGRARNGILLVQTSWFRGDDLGALADSIEDAAGVAWEVGHEGIVVKDMASPYVRSPSPSWMRLKRQHTLDLRVLSVRIIAGRLFSVEVEAQPGVRTTVAVGWTEAQRCDASINWLNAVIEVKHLGVNKSGRLRSPSYVRTRGDKK